MENAAKVIITRDRRDDVRVGVYQDGDYDGGAFLTAEDGAVTLIVAPGGITTSYRVDVTTGAVTRNA